MDSVSGVRSFIRCGSRPRVWRLFWVVLGGCVAAVGPLSGRPAAAGAGAGGGGVLVWAVSA